MAFKRSTVRSRSAPPSRRTRLYSGFFYCLFLCQKVMLDSDIAESCQVETKVLNQSVKRNCERLPAGFMFEPATEREKVLKSQIVTSKNT